MGREKSWPVPFLQGFHNGELLNGKALGLKAVLKSKFFGSSNFTINITAGKNVKDNKEKDSVGLQVACKEKEGWVLNSFVKGEWGDNATYPLNVEEDEEFYIRIEPMENKFLIFINGEKLCEYGYRMDLNYLNTVYIEGNVELHRVAWEGQYYMVPFEYELSSFKRGSTIYISGKPEKDSKRFDISLLKDATNIPLTVSVRMDDKQVVRNNEREGKWQDEETTITSAFPFEPEVDFDMIIDCKDNCYDILVNGNKLAVFYHRDPPDTVRQLLVEKDVELKSVYM